MKEERKTRKEDALLAERETKKVFQEVFVGRKRCNNNNSNTTHNLELKRAKKRSFHRSIHGQREPTM